MDKNFYGTLQTLRQNIRKNIQGGKNPYDILLDIAKDIGKITGEDSFYSEIYQDIISVYGNVLHEERVLEIELKEVSARRKKIAAALNNDNFSDEEKQRIQFALTRHDKEIERLTALIAEQKNSAKK